MNDKTFYMSILTVIVAFLLSVLVMDFLDYKEKIAFANAGLQQCVVEGKLMNFVIWQKECDK